MFLISKIKDICWKIRYLSEKIFRGYSDPEVFELYYNIFHGVSMGGVIARIICYLDNLENENRCMGFTYGSPKPCREGINDLGYNSHGAVVNYYNKGDIVPFLPPWYKKPERICLNKKWRPFWIAHDDYDWRFK